MSLAVLADHMASKGRNGDTMLVHMTPEEVHGLQALALAHGGQLTINPETGLPEANFLKKMLPMIAGMALNFIAPGVGTYIGGLIGASGAVGTGIAIGGLTGLATGSLKQGIMAGLGAYGGASLAGGLETAGMAAAQKAAMTPEALAQITGPELVGNATAEAVARNQLAEQATRDFMSKGAFDRFGAGISALGSEAGRTAALQGVGGASGLMRAGFAGMAGADALGQPQTATQMPGSGFKYPPRIRPMSFNQYTGELEQLPMFSAINTGGKTAGVSGMTPAPAQPEAQPSGGYNTGGIVALANGGAPVLPSDIGKYTPEQKADLYNKFLGQGFNDAAIRQAAGTQTDDDWRYLQNLAAQRGSPAVSGAERTVLTDPNWQSVKGQTGLEGLSSNIQNFFQTNPNVAYPAIGQEAAKYGVDTQDIIRALETGGGSRAMQTVTTSPDWRSRQGLSGLEGLSSNINMWLAEHPKATESDIRSAMDTWGLNEADIKRATGKNVAELGYKQRSPEGVEPLPRVDDTVPGTTGRDVTYGGDTVIPEYTAPQPKVTLGEAFKPTPQTMEQVRSEYEEGGGSTRMPTITDIKPGERTYTQNAVADLITGYLQTNPNAKYSDVQVFAASKGIPEMQARAAYNEFRFSTLTGGSKQAYDYLMGRAPYSTKPFVPGGGPIMKPYTEAVGLTPPSGFFGRKTIPNSPTNQNAQTVGGGVVYNSGITGGGTGTTGGMPSMAYSRPGSSAINPETGTAYTPLSGTPITDALLGTQDASKVPVVDRSTYTDSAMNELLANEAAERTRAAELSDVLNVEEIERDLEQARSETELAQDLERARRGEPSQQDVNRSFYYDYTAPSRSFDDMGFGSVYLGNTAFTPQERAAMLGLRGGGLADVAAAAAARGGNVERYNLGGYSDGGRLLRGPGDGVSDSIPATIGNKQPARLADGEFVIPARIVSEIGNGSTEAGARKLYAMMDRVQRARAKTTGKGKVAKNTRAEKYLPA